LIRAVEWALIADRNTLRGTKEGGILPTQLLKKVKAGKINGVTIPSRTLRAIDAIAKSLV